MFFGRRVQLTPASENAQPASKMIFNHVVFHMVRRVWHHGVWRRVNCRLNSPPQFLSPACARWRQRSYFFSNFSSVLQRLICFSGPYGYYIGFDLFQFRPSIEIDYILKFQFGPHAFNFADWAGILNFCGIKVLIGFNLILPCKLIINP